MIVGCGFAVTALTGGIPAVGSIAAACNITGLTAGITVSGVYLIYKDIVVIITFAICCAYLISFVGGYIRVIIAPAPKTTHSPFRCLKVPLKMCRQKDKINLMAAFLLLPHLKI